MSENSSPYGPRTSCAVGLDRPRRSEKRGENVGYRVQVPEKGKLPGERHFHRQWQIFDMSFRITVEEATGVSIKAS